MINRPLRFHLYIRVQLARWFFAEVDAMRFSFPNQFDTVFLSHLMYFSL